MITINEALKLLNLKSTNSFSQKNNPYKKYVKDGLFDIKTYTKETSLKEEAVAKTKLLIEYLVYEKNLSRAEIARVAGVNVQAIVTHEIGTNTAIKILRNINFYRPFWIKHFDEYYGYKVVENSRKVKFL